MAELKRKDVDDIASIISSILNEEVAISIDGIADGVYELTFRTRLGAIGDVSVDDDNGLVRTLTLYKGELEGWQMQSLAVPGLPGFEVAVL